MEKQLGNKTTLTVEEGCVRSSLVSDAEKERLVHTDALPVN